VRQGCGGGGGGSSGVLWARQLFPSPRALTLPSPSQPASSHVLRWGGLSAVACPCGVSPASPAPAFGLGEASGPLSLLTAPRQASAPPSRSSRLFAPPLPQPPSVLPAAFSPPLPPASAARPPFVYSATPLPSYPPSSLLIPTRAPATTVPAHALTFLPTRCTRSAHDSPLSPAPPPPSPRPYYPTGFEPVRGCLADPANARAGPGGVGDVKVGGDCARPPLRPPRRPPGRATSRCCGWAAGRARTRWPRRGTMNFFVFWKDASTGRPTLRSRRRLDGTILDGRGEASGKGGGGAFVCFLRVFPWPQNPKTPNSIKLI
jgi:hypothetical protein